MSEAITEVNKATKVKIVDYVSLMPVKGFLIENINTKVKIAIIEILKLSVIS